MRISNIKNSYNKLFVFFVIFFVFLFNITSGQEIIIEKLKDRLLPGEGFEKLSYRSGLSEKDDYFQLDGHNGGGRSGYHLNSILKLRMSGGNNLLDGINNDIDITCNGLADSIVPQAAALKRSLAWDDMAYVKTEVPDMTRSVWQRNILYLKETGLIVIDKTTARETSEFEIESSWTIPKNHKGISFDPSSVNTDDGTVISYAAQGKIKLDLGNVVKEVFPVRLLKGDSYNIGNLIYHESDSSLSQNIRKTGKNHFLVSGRKMILTGLDNFRSDDLEVSAGFFSIDSERIFTDEFQNLVISDIVTVKSDVPVSLSWSLNDNSLLISSSDAGTLSYESDSEKYFISFSPGNNVYKDIKIAGMTEKLTAILGELKNRIYHDPLPFSKIAKQKTGWNPDWQIKRTGDASYLDISVNGEIWAAWDKDTDYKIGKISSRGVVLNEVDGKGKILSFKSAKSKSQTESFSVLAGFMDDTVRAFSSNGKETWNFRAELDTSFRIGDKYVAPCFSDPTEVSGVYDILVDDLWGTGKDEIVIGRPVTLEFRSLKGELIRRLPTQWGTNTTLSLLKDPGGENSKNLVLAGKFITGYPGHSAVNKNHENISDNLFNGAKKGWTFMNGWGQQGLSQLIIEDLNNDSIPELITAITGNWNELRVWNSKVYGLDEMSTGIRCEDSPVVISGGTANRGPRISNDPPVWMKYFGPYTEGTWIIQGVLQRDPVNKMKERFMRSLVVADLNDDSNKEVVVGLRNGWLHVFDHKGTLLWQKKFEHDIRCVESVKGRHGRLAVGLSNGNIFLIDESGKILETGKLEASVEKILVSDDHVYAGTREGAIAKFNLR